MKILEIHSAAEIRQFHDLPHQLYRLDKNWIAPLRESVEVVFDRSRNRFFANGEAARWLLFEEKTGRCIGRVAAFINRDKAFSFDQPTGGMGFFEVENNETAAFKLFETCQNWLAERGMEAMIGPVNFGENDRFWGLLTDNFNEPPVHLLNHNPPFYPDFFQKWGFAEYYRQLSFEREVAPPMSELIARRAAKIADDPRFEIRFIEAKKLETITDDFLEIYNAAWRTHPNFREMSRPKAVELIQKIKPIADDRLTMFAYIEGRPAGFYVALPDVNEQFRHFFGDRMTWWNKLIFAGHRLFFKNRTIRGLVFGIIPEAQKLGLESLIFIKFADSVQADGQYKRLIISWIGDFNPRMIRLMEMLGGRVYRQHATMLFLFDRSKTGGRMATIA